MLLLCLISVSGCARLFDQIDRKEVLSNTYSAQRPLLQTAQQREVVGLTIKTDAAPVVTFSRLLAIMFGAREVITDVEFTITNPTAKDKDMVREITLEYAKSRWGEYKVRNDGAKDLWVEEHKKPEMRNRSYIFVFWRRNEVEIQLVEVYTNFGLLNNIREKLKIELSQQSRKIYEQVSSKFGLS